MTPEDWRDRLNAALDKRRPDITRCESYYEGEHRLAFATAKFREAFGDLFREFADNWCGVVVDAAVERLEVQGFRFGPDEKADDEAWRIWQANQLDAESGNAHETAVATGTSYLLVSPGQDEATPLITVEHPSEMIVATEPGQRRQRVAAFKKWIDDDGRAMGTLYLPDGVFKWQTAEKYRLRSKPKWIPRQTEDIGEDGWAGANDLGLVPVVPIVNRPNMRGEGRSDIYAVIREQDAVNKLVSDMMVASEFAAFRQRWATGIEVMRDPDTGEPLRGQQYNAAMDRIFATANEDAKFGSFEASDLSNYVKAVEMIVQHIAAQTRTPPHYLLGQSGAFPSGESLKATETGLVARVKRKMTTFGEGYEEAMRLAFLLVGDKAKSAVVGAETIWRDPESRTESEVVDALTKMRTLGVPIVALWERWGASPAQIERWKQLAEEEALATAAADFTRVFGRNGQGVADQPNANGQTAPVPA